MFKVKRPVVDMDAHVFTHLPQINLAYRYAHWCAVLFKVPESFRGIWAFIAFLLLSNGWVGRGLRFWQGSILRSMLNQSDINTFLCVVV